MASRYRGVIKIKTMKDKTISASLIYRKIEGKLSAVEEERFEAWLKEGWEHREYYERMRRMYQQENVQEVVTGEIQEAWGVFEKRVQGQRRIERRQRWVWVMSAVASVALVICCCWFVYYRANTEQKLNVAVQKIVPGQYNAVLEMADGATYQLGEQQYFLQERTGNQIKVDSTVLSYLPVNNKSGLSQDVVYNKLSVPKGGEYRIELEDGTKVWINSASRLRYPVVFSGNIREVYLEGEAYFHVTASKEHPFIVKTKDMDVMVTGTEFNVKAYPDEMNVQTTLLQGVVTVFSGFEKKEKVEIKPNQQVEWCRDSVKMRVREVDPDLFMAWKNGRFIFRQDRLGDIMRTLARWYGVEVVYLDESVKSMLFAGKLDRSEEITPILDVLRTTDKLSVDVKGKKIVIGLK